MKYLILLLTTSVSLALVEPAKNRPRPWITFKLGDKGEQVFNLNAYLILNGYLDFCLNGENHEFTKETIAAIREFKKDHKITPANGEYSPDVAKIISPSTMEHTK